MAHGFVCKHCGQYEASHDKKNSADDADDIRKEYKKSLAECEGYHSEDPAEEMRCEKNQREGRLRQKFYQRYRAMNLNEED